MVIVFEQDTITGSDILKFTDYHHWLIINIPSYVGEANVTGGHWVKQIQYWKFKQNMTHDGCQTVYDYVLHGNVHWYQEFLNIGPHRTQFCYKIITRG